MNRARSPSSPESRQPIGKLQPIDDLAEALSETWVPNIKAPSDPGFACRVLEAFVMGLPEGKL